MAHKKWFIRTVSLLAMLALLLPLGATAQGPQPPTLPSPSWDDARSFPRPVTPGDVEAQSVSAAVALGEPGLSFRYVKTFGVSGVPYLDDSNYITNPYGVGIDGSDNLWVGEWAGARALKYTGAGVFRMSIGRAGYQIPDEDTFISAADVAVDGNGSVWVVDAEAHRVVKFDSGGNYVSQLGETWESGSDNDHFDSPRSVAFDSAGNIYVSDAYNHRIQVFDSSGTYSTTIGVTGESGSDTAHFNTTRHIAIDNSDLLYVPDAGNHRVQILDVSSTSAVTYVATIGVSSESGSDNSRFNWPMGVAVDDSRIYVADNNNHRVQIFDRATRAYQATIGAGSTGSGNDQFYHPLDVAVDSASSIYVADGLNHRVQKFNSSLAYQRTFGTTGVPYLTDNYHFNAPYGVAVDSSSNIIVTEEWGNRLLKLNSSGVAQWTAGEAGITGSDNTHFSRPRGAAVDSNGNIYVAEHDNHRVQIYDNAGNYVATLGTGWGTGSYKFSNPSGVAIGPNGYIYVADTWNHRIQIYNSNRIYMATLGITGSSGSDNAHFNAPHGVFVDSNGNIYVLDSYNHRVQVFDSDRVYQRTIGTTGEEGDDFAHFSEPRDVAVDGSGNIYVADAWNNRIQVFDSNGAYLTTIGGDWGGNIGRLRGALGVEVDSNGNVYITDWDNHRIQKFAPGVPGWEQVNINGFGDSDNGGAWSLGTFNNALYASTSNFASGAEVYRFSSGSWEQVVSGGFGDSTNVGVDWFAEFNGYLYAGTWNDNGSGSNGGQIWRSATGDSGSWEQVVNNGFGDSVNGDIMTLAGFNGYLYAGTWSSDTGVHGAEIWRSSTGNTGSWARVVSDGFNGDSSNRGTLSMEMFDGHLYAATDNGNTGGETWRTSGGATWTQANADGFGDTANTRVVSLEVFDDKLYAGTWNSANGGEIWRTANGVTWEQVMSGGFGNVDNRDIASLIAFDGGLYVIVGNFNTGPEVWRSSTGNTGSWQKVIDTGFGGGRAAGVDWDNITAVFDGNLYVGTFTWGNGGGRVWRNKPYSIYLPVVLRNYFNNPYEDNDSWQTAYGPLAFGAEYRAYPDDGSDFYYFDLSTTENVTIEVENYQATGDLILYRHRAGDEPEHVKNWGKGGSTMTVGPLELGTGKYYVRVYTTAGHNTTSLYTLTVTN